ncbi:MAG: hypothetical protein AB8B51_10115 [Sedimentitalea sp.]
MGEEVTYSVVLTLPEIAMESVVLSDLLPTGLVFVGAEITVNGVTDLGVING